MVVVRHDAYRQALAVSRAKTRDNGDMAFGFFGQGLSTYSGPRRRAELERRMCLDRHVCLHGASVSGANMRVIWARDLPESCETVPRHNAYLGRDVVSGGASIAMRLLLAPGAMETLTKELWGFWGPEGRFWSAPGRVGCRSNVIQF